jgi:hypothetical protein
MPAASALIELSAAALIAGSSRAQHSTPPRESEEFGNDKTKAQWVPETK